MNESPILFSTPMVAAIIAGNKTMTRRIVKPELTDHYFQSLVLHASGKYTFCPNVNLDPKPDEVIEVKCKYGTPGNLLWVKESFFAYGQWVNGFSKRGSQKFRFKDLTGTDFNYKYQDNPPLRIKTGRSETIGWYKRSSLFMPKAAARIWLEITNISVERLQNITNEDSLKEGIKVIEPNEAYYDYQEFAGSFATPRGSFFSLWMKINGEESFNQNPWVWVISFKVLSTTGRPS